MVKIQGKITKGPNNSSLKIMPKMSAETIAGLTKQNENSAVLLKTKNIQFNSVNKLSLAVKKSP